MSYFRITGYSPENDFCFIVDSNGMFEKLWQFSAFLIPKGIKILEVANADKFLDVNIKPIKEDAEHIILRANADGKPKYIEQKIDGITYKALQVADKIYIPDRTQMI